MALPELAAAILAAVLLEGAALAATETEPAMALAPCLNTGLLLGELPIAVAMLPIGVAMLPEPPTAVVMPGIWASG